MTGSVAARTAVNLTDPSNVLEELRRTCSLAMSVLDREVERLLDAAASQREVDSVVDDLAAVRSAYNSLCDRSFKGRFPRDAWQHTEFVPPAYDSAAFDVVGG